MLPQPGEEEMRYALPIVVALALASCAPYPPPPPAPPPGPPAPPPMAGPPVHVARTAIGPVFADARGMTLYTWAKDPPGHSLCNGRCAVIWPPLLAGPAAAPAGPWSIAARADGRHQWTYRGKPLYGFVKDKQPGQTAGQGSHGFGALWTVARP
jgi:predicted lipoprotein with Yx(FWY)xxD motif